MSCIRQEKVRSTPLGLAHRLDSLSLHYIDQDQTGAFTIAIIQHDSVLYQKALGHADHNREIVITTDHKFLLASISKLVGASMVMKLVEENKLRLDQTLAELLPEFPRRDQAKLITLQQLLSHTSGLVDYAIIIDTMYMSTGKNPTREDYLDFFDSHDLMFEPGERYAYTNSGFKLMEMIIERVTGHSFAQEINRIINQPAGLDFQLIRERIRDPLMTAYFDHSDTTLIPSEHWTWISGDGGMTATALDLARFGQAWSDGTIISSNSFEVMTTPMKLSDGLETGYGLGVRTGLFEGEPVIGHSGGNISAYAMMMYFPQRDISIAVMDNTDGSPTSAMSIIGPVALEVLDKKRPDLPKLEKVELDTNIYCGLYHQYSYLNTQPIKLDIYFNEKTGHVHRRRQHSNDEGQELYYLGNNFFSYEPYPMDRIEFIMDQDGNAIAYRHYYYGLFQRMGFRVDL